MAELKPWMVEWLKDPDTEEAWAAVPQELKEEGRWTEVDHLIATAIEATLERTGEPVGAKCLDCGLPYADDGFADLLIPTEVWNRIMDAEPCTEGAGGLLCACCMTKRCEELNIKTKAVWASGPFCSGVVEMPSVERTDREREALAALEHEQWAHWTRYMLDNLTPENIERWRRQCDTDYADLSERGKESDRKWADRVIAILAAQEGNDG